MSTAGWGLLPGAAGPLCADGKRGGFSPPGNNGQHQNLAEGCPLPLSGLAFLNARLGRSVGRFGAFSCFPQQAAEAERLSPARGSEHGPGPFAEPFLQQPPRLTARHSYLARVLIPLRELSFRGPKLRVTDSIFPPPHVTKLLPSSGGVTAHPTSKCPIPAQNKSSSQQVSVRTSRLLWALFTSSVCTTYFALSLCCASKVS